MVNQPKPITEETAKRLTDLLSRVSAGQITKPLELAKKPVYQIRKSQILAAVTGFIGLVIFAFGVENFISSIPRLSSPLTEIGLGLLLLIVSGISLKNLSKQ